MDEICAGCGKVCGLEPFLRPYGGIVGGKEYCFYCMLEEIKAGRLRP